MRPRVLGWHLLLVFPLLAGACIPAPTQSGTTRLDVSAGPDREVDMGQSATLSADVNGRTSGFAFSWEQQTGPVADVTLEDASRAETQVGPFDTLGEYKFRVLAATQDGRFGQDIVILTVVEPSENDNDNDNGNDNDNDNDLGTDGNDNMDTDGNDNVNTDGNNNDNDNANDNSDVEVDPDDILVRINAPLSMPAELETPLTALLPPGGLEATYQWQITAGDAVIEDLTARETNITANTEDTVTVQVTMTVPEFGRDFTDEVDITVDPQGTFRVVISGQSEGISGTEFDFRSDFGNPQVGLGITSQWEVIEGTGTFGMPNIPVPQFTPTSEGIVVVQVTSVVPDLDLVVVDDFVLLVFPVLEVDLDVTVNNLAVLGESISIPVVSELFDVDDLDFQWEIIKGDVTIDDPTSNAPQVVIDSLDTAELLVSVEGVINGLARSGSKTVFVTGVENLNPRVDIQVTDFGLITLELDGEAAPQTVANLIHYVDDRFFDGLLFHRNSCNEIPSSGLCEPFVLQGGGFKVVDGELVKQEEGLRDGVPSEAGNGLSSSEIYSIAMALSAGDSNSGTTQFFINMKNNGFLDTTGFTTFGRVAEETIPVVDAIVATERVENTALGGEVSRPVPDVIMEQVRRAP